MGGREEVIWSNIMEREHLGSHKAQKGTLAQIHWQKTRPHLPWCRSHIATAADTKLAKAIVPPTDHAAVVQKGAVVILS